MDNTRYIICMDPGKYIHLDPNVRYGYRYSRRIGASQFTLIEAFEMFHRLGYDYNRSMLEVADWTCIATTPKQSRYQRVKKYLTTHVLKRDLQH